MKFLTGKTTKCSKPPTSLSTSTVSLLVRHAGPKLQNQALLPVPVRRKSGSLMFSERVLGIAMSQNPAKNAKIGFLMALNRQNGIFWQSKQRFPEIGVLQIILVMDEHCSIETNGDHFSTVIQVPHIVHQLRPRRQLWRDSEGQRT